jgi:hypothetical protein
VSGGVVGIAVVFYFSPDVHSYQILYQMALYSGILISTKRILKTAEYRKKRLKMERRSYNSGG